MKKIIALALALIMSLSMASVAFAATPDASVATLDELNAALADDAVNTIKVTSTIELTVADTVIDGKGKTITADSALNAVFFIKDTATLKNFTFSEITNVENVVRVLSTTATIENCKFLNNASSYSMILTRLSNVTVKDCEFTGNTTSHVLYLDGYEAPSSADNTYTLDTCYFEDNTVSGYAVVYSAGEQAFTVKNSTFYDNTVNVSGNGGVVYGDKLVATGNTFEKNTVTAGATKRAGIIVADGGEVTGNTFSADNSISGGDNITATVVSKGDGLPLDLSANYWGDSEAPVEGVDYVNAKPAEENTFVVDSYASAAGTVVSIGSTNPGEEIVVATGIDRTIYKVKGYDFTTGTKGYKGASYIDEVKIDKNGNVVLVLKENYKLAEDKTIKGAIELYNKTTKTSEFIEVEYTVNNVVFEVYGAKKASEAESIPEGPNVLIVMDEDGGYVKFEEEMLSGVVKMNKDEKTFLNLIYGGQEETVEAIEELLGEEYLDEAIIEYYEFETRAFKNEVAFSYEAYEDDPHYFYLYNDGKLTAIDAVYNDDEDVEAWEWTAVAEGTIIVTDVEIVLADEAEEETKNPDTGASDVVGMASALAVVSLIAAGAVALKK